MNHFSRIKPLFVFLSLFMMSSNIKAQVLSDEERKLYQLIMDYRKEKGLSVIDISKSLTKVAQTHVRDLGENKPDVGRCNTHSWSSNGTWSSCCYTPDHAQASCMWSKPAELTTYKGNGYEIAMKTSGTATAESALMGWKLSPGHNAVIINQGMWSQKWNAIGIGIYKGYAVAWFGRESEF